MLLTLVFVFDVKHLFLKCLLNVEVCLEMSCRLFSSLLYKYIEYFPGWEACNTLSPPIFITVSDPLISV